jgi:hypothetical protein
MSRMHRCLATSILSSALILSTSAHAMPIPQYDQMAQSDKKDYRVSLVEGAAKALDAHGEHEQAQKLITIFTDKGDNGGFNQLAKNLEILRAINKENAANPNNKEPVYEVEHAFALTLKNNGISIPVSVLLAINKDFKPGHSSGSKARPK